MSHHSYNAQDIMSIQLGIILLSRYFDLGIKLALSIYFAPGDTDVPINPNNCFIRSGCFLWWIRIFLV